MVLRGAPPRVPGLRQAGRALPELVAVAGPVRLVVHGIDHVGAAAVGQRPQQIAVADVAGRQGVAARDVRPRSPPAPPARWAGSTSPITSGIALAACEPVAYWPAAD